MHTIDPLRSEDDEVTAEAVATVFRTVEFGVLVAWLTCGILVATLGTLGLVGPRRGALFVAYIGLCAGLHIALARAFKGGTTRVSRCRDWGAAFAAVALLEGVGWGWAPVALVPSGNFDAQLLCLACVLGIVSGAIPAFSPYLPAFLALFAPAILPYGIEAAFSPLPLQRGSAVLALLFVIAAGTFSVVFSQRFRRLVDLRLHAETLARDLRRQKEIAEAANRAKSSFLAAASHDLRQPVHALGLFVGALRGMPMSAGATAILAQIEASSQAMDGLFAALLDISRLDAGTVEVHREVFAIGPVIERIGREQARDADEKGIALTVHPCAAHLHSDPILVERVLRNLVSNAVRYTAEGRVVVGCRRRGAHVSVEVLDTGPGIPPGQQERIFEEYYQIGNLERDRSKGLGLGLAIVRRLTTLLGCPITLQSVPGRGARFAVAIPRADPAMIRREQAREIAVAPLRGRMIVVVDDEADIRAAMSTVLERWGHRVIVAGDGAEAIARLAGCPTRPDLIVSDFRLRGTESGIDVIEALRSEFNERIPAILITGDTAPERLIEARDSGLLLLHKPVSNSRLRAAITNAMAGVTV